MSAMGHFRRFDDVRAMSAHHPTAAEKRTFQIGSFVPILLQKSQIAERQLSRQKTSQAVIAD